MDSYIYMYMHNYAYIYMCVSHSICSYICLTHTHTHTHTHTNTHKVPVGTDIVICVCLKLSSRFHFSIDWCKHWFAWHTSQCSVVVITCASHAQGPRFNPGHWHCYTFCFLFVCVFHVDMITHIQCTHIV